MEIELSLEEFKQKDFEMAYDWVSAFMGSNPTWTLDKLMETPKWKMQEKNYDVYKVKYNNGLYQRIVVRKSDNKEVWREIPKVDNRGGVREGAGRKATGRTKMPLTIQVTPEQNKKIRKSAQEQGKTVSQYVLQFIPD